MTSFEAPRTGPRSRSAVRGAAQRVQRRAVAGGAVALTTCLLMACASNGTDLARPGTAATSTAALPDRAARADAPTGRKTETVKIGLLLPLTGGGQAGLVADTMRKAAELAVIEGKAGHLSLAVRDDKGTPEGAEAAARDLVGQGAELVLGPLLARSVQAAAPVARQGNVPLIAFSNDRQAQSAGVTLLSFQAEPEVQRVVSFAASRGKKRFAALVGDDPYGRLVEAAFRAAVARSGGSIVAAETYPPQSAGMLEAVRRLRDAIRGIEEHGDPVDALFLPGGEDTLAVLAPQIRQAQIDTRRIQVIGTGALDYVNAGRDATLVGAWFAAPDPKGWTAFSESYVKAYGHVPPRIASLAYDAVTVAAALANGPDGARYIPSQLTRVSGFTGVDGWFRLQSDGGVDRALAILQVGEFGAKVIDLPSPPAGDAVRPVASTGLGGPRGNPAQP